MATETQLQTRDKAVGSSRLKMDSASQDRPQKPEEGALSDAAALCDPIMVLPERNRLLTVPLEGDKLNVSKEELDVRHGDKTAVTKTPTQRDLDLSIAEKQSGKPLGEASRRKAPPLHHTNPLFPALPRYGPPSLLRKIQCAAFRASAFFLSLAFLGVIVLGALFTSIPPFLVRAFRLATLRNPDKERPFYDEEMRRSKMRREMKRNWTRRRSQSRVQDRDTENPVADSDRFVPKEGGPDPIVCDIGYYARRVGLDVESFQVQTEDGFILDLWHVYDPREYSPLSEEERSERGPSLLAERKRRIDPAQGLKFPVLLMHGLLQSAGAFCVNDDDSIAFFLCKSGYDVWLGSNRCGFSPKHVFLDCSDPRMWCWNIRQMGVFDLPALTFRVILETGFEKIGLVCHSQGTTEAFVALAKEQRPDLGEKLTVFCALAPAAYAGPLVGKMYFKFMRVISPAVFRLIFGIHAFIPLMMTMHSIMRPQIYGWLGYTVFSFLFNWTDNRWDRELRNRMFQFAPVYVSAESMRWWLGREGFAKHKCILATKEEWRAEEREDNEADGADSTDNKKSTQAHRRKPKGSTAWYNAQAPPFALWVCGNDNLVDGERLLRRFQKGREPHVKVVHSKVIPEFEHLDVIWAIDAPDQVFKELREVLWKTVPCGVRDMCRVPKGCEGVPAWAPPAAETGPEDDQLQSSSSSEELVTA